MSSLNLVGSAIVAGIVIVAIISLTMFFTDSSQKITTDLTCQQNMSELTKVIEFDMDKAGLRDTTGYPVLVCAADTLCFRGDLDDNGIVDTITYFHGSVAQLNSPPYSTPNPGDFLVYRVRKPHVTGVLDTTLMNVGATSFQFAYCDSAGGPTTVPTSVRGIKLSMRLEGQVAGPDSSFSGVAWQRTFYPRNMNSN